MALSEDFSNSHRGVVITVASAIGGMSKTTLSSLLASQISKSSDKASKEGKMARPLKVCLIDLDIFDGDQGFLLGITQPNALDLIFKEDLNPEVISESLIFSPKLGFHALLASSKGFAGVNDLDVAHFYRKVIEILRGDV